jgi:hypothetical protein
MDLSIDFADFSSPDGKVLEVRNTFLHVRNPDGSNPGAASRSDFVCNYSGYPELEQVQVPESSAIAAKSKSRRPGKKARARMIRRLSTLQSINSVSTEASAEPQSNSTNVTPSEASLEARSDHTASQSLSEAASCDDTSAFGESLSPSVISLVDDFVDDCLSMTLSDVASLASQAPAPIPALVNTQPHCAGDGSLSRSTSCTSITALLPFASTSSDKLQQQEVSQEKASKGGAVWIAGAFACGALFAIALLALFWSSGAVQVQFAPTINHEAETARSALETFKEQAEKRLATQERMLQDIVAHMQTTQASVGMETKDARSGSTNAPAIQQGLEAASDFSLSQSNGSTVASGIDLLIAKPDMFTSLEKLSAATSLPHEDSNEAARGWWINSRLAGAVWLGMVFFCSMFQTTLASNLQKRAEQSDAKKGIVTE